MLLTSKEEPVEFKKKILVTEFSFHQCDMEVRSLFSLRSDPTRSYLFNSLLAMVNDNPNLNPEAS